MNRTEVKKEIVKIFVAMIGKKENRLLNLLLDLFDNVVGSYIKTIARLKDKLSFMDGQKRIIREHSIQYSQLHSICKEQNKELKGCNKVIEKLTNELNITLKQRDKLKNRLYKKWSKVKSWLLKRNKKKIKKYVKKKKVQILKLKRKVKK